MLLRDNPFAILGAILRDSRRRIIDLFEEKNLVGREDEKRLQKVKQILTSPKDRVGAEIAWLPGLGVKEIATIIGRSLPPPRLRNLVNNPGIPALTRANVLAEKLMRVRSSSTASSREQVLWQISALAATHEEIDAEETILVLNEERAAAKFSPISNPGIVVEALGEQRKHYGKAIHEALDKFSASVLVEVVTCVVNKATNKGVRHAPVLIEDLVQSFEIEAQEFFEYEDETIDKCMDRLRNVVKNRRSNELVNRAARKLEAVVGNWDRVAQPIQVMHRGRGTHHKASEEMALKLRKFAIEMNNEYHRPDLSKRLTDLQRSVFAEDDHIVETADEDKRTLDSFEKKSQDDDDVPF